MCAATATGSGLQCSDFIIFSSSSPPSAVYSSLVLLLKLFKTIFIVFLLVVIVHSRAPSHEGNMADALQTFANMAAIASVIIPSTVMLGGVVPRVGPGRALALAARSWMHLAKKVSQRDDATRTLRSMLQNLGEDQYIVVTGQKGVGKSVVVNTATQRTCGVVSVPVAPGTSQKTIVADVLSEITNSRVGFVDPRPSVRRVLWWYGWFLPRPIVVLCAGERMDGEAYAGIPGAARVLASYGLRVLIDGSTNSLPSEVLTTLRQNVLELEPMSRNTALSIPEYESLFHVLRQEGLEDVAWQVLGGVPAHFDQIVTQLKRNEPTAYRRVIVNYILDEVGKAVSRRDRMLAAPSAMKSILDLFKTQDEVPESLLTEKGIVSPSPNKVLRVVLRSHVAKLVPADAAMALVLRFCLSTTPSIEVLQKLLANDRGDGAASSEP